MSGDHTDILLPGLFDRLSEWRANYGELPDCAALARLLACATLLPLATTGYEATLWSLFDAPSTADGELPVGAVLGPGDGVTTCRADPVYLKPGIADIVLQPVDGRSLTEGDLQALVATVNGAVAEWGARFDWHPDTGGYLVLRDAWSLRTTPPSVVAGRTIGRHLPQGPQRLLAHRLGNLVQMALHEAPFNRDREARGQLPVNALWLWGCGATPVAPEVVLAHAYRTICATEPFAVAVATRARPKVPVVATPEEVPSTERRCVLAVIDDLYAPAVCDDVAAWGEALDVVAGKVAALTRGVRGELRIFPCDGRVFAVRPVDRLKFWRKIPPLHNWASSR